MAPIAWAVFVAFMVHVGRVLRHGRRGPRKGAVQYRAHHEKDRRAKVFQLPALLLSGVRPTVSSSSDCSLGPSERWIGVGGAYSSTT